MPDILITILQVLDHCVDGELIALLAHLGERLQRCNPQTHNIKLEPPDHCFNGELIALLAHLRKRLQRGTPDILVTILEVLDQRSDGTGVANMVQGSMSS